MPLKPTLPTTATLVMLVLAALLLASIAAAQTGGKAAKDVKLDDLNFLSGHNRGETDAGIIDEHWSEVGGDSMIGMFREIKEGRVRTYEFLAIEQTSKGLIMTVRRFSPGAVVNEKLSAQSYVLSAWSPGQAVFERTDKAAKMTYRSTSRETLQVSIERAGRAPEVFEYIHTSE